MNEVSYSQEFKAALKTGKVLVRQIFDNPNSTKNQATIQFVQMLPEGVGATGDSGEIVAALQGIPNLRQTVTSLMSVKKEVLQAKGIAFGYYCEDDNILTAEEIVGFDINIQVKEDTVKNSLSPSQTPKKNPTTDEVLTYQGKPIYRHTTVVKGEPNHVFLRASSVAPEAVSEAERIMVSTTN
jgi:hypothetical protein